MDKPVYLVAGASSGMAVPLRASLAKAMAM